MSLRFQWDPAKADANLRKHGVAFEEAITVFRNPLAAIFDDDQHSGDEAREIIVGHSQRRRLLIVIFVERGEFVRIVSARTCTRREQSDYEEHLKQR